LIYLWSAVLLLALLSEPAPELEFELLFPPPLELPFPLPEPLLAALELLLDELSEADDAVVAPLPFPFPLPLSLLAETVSAVLSEFADPLPEPQEAGVPLFLA
jgi:hypothetical protein